MFSASNISSFSRNSPEEQVIIAAEMKNWRGSLSQEAGFRSWDSSNPAPSLDRPPPSQLVLILVDPYVGNSPESISDISDLRYATSVNYRVDKFKNYQHLLDAIDAARQLKVDETDRIAHCWQLSESRSRGGYRLSHYLSTAFTSEVEDYFDTYVRLLVALGKYYRDFKETSEAWEDLKAFRDQLEVGRKKVANSFSGTIGS